MNIREEMEQREMELLSPYAAHSRDSRGRDRYEEECDIRTVYQRDRDRILHCKSFRRLKDKTQVFLAPQGDHYRNRLTHTLEVSQTARTIAKALRLNDDLVEAIALGHDLGHTPFGHAGERALDRVCPLGFAHYRQSIRVVECLEKNGAGLNLTWEVRDGILNHRTSGSPIPWRDRSYGSVIRFPISITIWMTPREQGLSRKMTFPSPCGFCWVRTQKNGSTPLFMILWTTAEGKMRYTCPLRLRRDCVTFGTLCSGMSI